MVELETRNPLKRIKYLVKARYVHFLGMFVSNDIVDFKKIPIVINNYNRLSTLCSLVSALESRGYSNIFIIDNASTYPPLLSYYDSCPYTIFRLDKNVGHDSLWKTDLYEKFIKGYYVYTDSDVVPVEDCPDNFLEYFWKILQRYKYATKVGFGLKIDDLPDCFEQKQEIVKWEEHHWWYEIESELFRAPIDTTFALYRPFAKRDTPWYVEQYRTGGRYVMRHLPWYVDTKNMQEEELYYVNSCSKSSSLSEMIKSKR